MRGHKRNAYTSTLPILLDNTNGSSVASVPDDEEDTPTEEAWEDGQPLGDGIWLLSSEENTPLVLVRVHTPPPRPERSKTQRARIVPRVDFEMLARLPGYEGCLLADSRSGELLYAGGVSSSTQAVLAEGEAAVWRAIQANVALEGVEEIIFSTEEHIQILRPAEPGSQLIVVIICSREQTNLALIRLAFNAFEQP